MLNNTRQPILKGGDIRRIDFLDSAIQSAPHWTRKRNRAKPAYLEPNSGSLQKPVEGLSALAIFPTKNRRGKKRNFS